MKFHMENAYFTVEAAFIIPIVILFTTIMIFMSFYAYNRCYLEHSAYQAALIGSSDYYDDAEDAYNAANQVAATAAQSVFAVSELTHGVKVDYSFVTVTYHCVVNMPFKPWIGEYIKGFSESFMTFDISKSAPRIKATRRIREFRKVNDLTNIGNNDGGEEENDDEE